ncbi:MAG: hypothetical protein NTV22_19755 [bacterium]|nr:hypothetical protein [bacterium]
MSNQPDTSLKDFGVHTPDRVPQPPPLPALAQPAPADPAARTPTGQELIEHEKLQSVLAMAGAVCHELNQPLQVLSGFIDLLLLDSPADDSRTEYLRIMAEQVKRMTEVTRKLRNIARYKTMPYGSALQIVDLEQSAAPDDARSSAVPETTLRA